MEDQPGRVVEQLFRHSAGQLTATLARALGPARLDLAEEAVQEAMVRALQRWPFAGIPDNPRGWLYQVARNTALDLVRHDAVVRAKLPLLYDPEQVDARGDDELALMFLCCHPDLPQVSQVALTLRTVGGLGVNEIATALLTQPATVAQRLVRAKRWLREHTEQLEVPGADQVEVRMDSVLSVLYLLFSAGYDAVEGDNAVRSELCAESIRLCRLLLAHPRTDLPQARALLALMLLQGSRLKAHTDDRGDVLLLADQDRARWDQAMVAEGIRVFDSSLGGDTRSAFHIEAAIALCHTVEPTDWARVVTLYDDLLAIRPSPVAALNRAIAAAMVGGLDPAELSRLEEDPALRDYHLLPAALGGLWLRAGRPEIAARYYRDALTKRCSTPTQRFLERQLTRCDLEISHVR